MQRGWTHHWKRNVRRVAACWLFGTQEEVVRRLHLINTSWLPSPSFWVELRSSLSSVGWCFLVPSFFGWALLFLLLLLRGVAFLPPCLGAAAFLLCSVGWCCLASFFFGRCRVFPLLCVELHGLLLLWVCCVLPSGPVLGPWPGPGRIRPRRARQLCQGERVVVVDGCWVWKWG